MRKNLHITNLHITSVVLLAAFCLVMLGMRTPSLNHHSGPKQHVRAVVEDVSKAPVSICADQHLDADVGPTIAAASGSSEALSFVTLVVSTTPTLVRHLLPSRASPSFSYTRS